MKKRITVAGLQMHVSDIQKNKQLILRALKRAAKDRADFLLTPEGSLSGYHTNFLQEELAQALQEITGKAREYKVGLALGTCFKAGEKNYNQVRIYSPHGRFLGVHNKILRCSPYVPPNTGEMKTYATGKLRTFSWENITFGALICNDLWATPGYTTIPNLYLAWQLKKKGARFILHAVNSGTMGFPAVKAFHESSGEMIARALGIPIVEVNAAVPGKRINARSGMISSEGKRIMIMPDKGEYYFLCKLTV